MTQTSATHGGPMPGASEDQARLVRGTLARREDGEAEDAPR